MENYVVHGNDRTLADADGIVRMLNLIQETTKDDQSQRVDLAVNGLLDVAAGDADCLDVKTNHCGLLASDSPGSGFVLRPIEDKERKGVRAVSLLCNQPTNQPLHWEDGGVWISAR